MDFLRHVKFLARVALDAVIPAQCALCPAVVGRAGQVCAGCFAKLALISAPFCRSCAVPFGKPGDQAGAGTCDDCWARPPLWRAARAAFVYNQAAKSLVMGLKYGGREENAVMLAQHMARAGRDILAEADYLVPVPLHWRRRVARRFNQSALLARLLAREAGIAPLYDALIRRQDTHSLGRLGAASRADLLRDAIAARAPRAAQLRGRRLVLIDDVLTSGATGGACAAALLAAGAAHVDVLVACRVPKTELT